MTNDDFVSVDITGYIKHISKNPMECDHDYITLRMNVPVPHDAEPETGEFCENCMTRLDHPYGLRHYQEKFKYQEMKGNKK